ncbi:40S ribosomal protein S30 [Zea mays]|jgi:hypothetical protein
MASC